jgi:hemoglobin
MADSTPETLADWAGGPEAFRRLFTRFYERVRADPLLAPVFAAMDSRHAEHVAAFVDTADEVGLADDPEFRARVVGYLEWGSRLAVMNSRDGAVAPDQALEMPAWTWSSPGGPYRGT